MGAVVFDHVTQVYIELSWGYHVKSYGYWNHLQLTCTSTVRDIYCYTKACPE